MYGIVLPGPDVGEGVPIVKGGDVAAARLTPVELSHTTREIEAPYARARLREGDLVFAIRGGIGDVEIVPKALDGANITQDVARVAPAADVDPRWLRAALETASVRHQVIERTTGATIRGLNIWELKRIAIPNSGQARQQRDLEQLIPVLARRDGLVGRLNRQIALLQEHQHALIAAAVTGAYEVPGATAP
jgi:type I restriction enzyme S subunit